MYSGDTTTPALPTTRFTMSASHQMKAQQTLRIYAADATKAQCPCGGTCVAFFIYFPRIQGGSSLTPNVTCRAVEVGTKARKEVINWTFCSACYIFLHGEVHIPTARNPDRKLPLIPTSCFPGVVLDGVARRVVVSTTPLSFSYIPHVLLRNQFFSQDFHDRARTHVLPTWLQVVREYYDALVSI